MDFNEIKALIELVNDSNLSEVNIKNSDFKICIRTKHYTAAVQQQATAVPIPVPQTVATPIVPASPVMGNVAHTPPPATTNNNATNNDDAAADNLITIPSPMIGTFYRASSPDKPPYIKIGDTVSPNTVICIIEAMKLFNEIEAEKAGKVVKILVDDSAPVEYGQPLFLLEPL